MTDADADLHLEALRADILDRVAAYQQAAAAGRAYAAYGGIYVAASLLWLWLVEGTRPDGWDLAGAVAVLVGSALILWAPRGT